MPPVNWAMEPSVIVSDFAMRHGHPHHAGLILHGVWAVDGLHYLAELDLEDDLSTDTIRGYPPDRVDVAHVRWATATCVTALDLCAAGIGRILCGHMGIKELAATHFARRDDGNGKHRGALPPLILNWFDELFNDAGYMKVKRVRDALTHGLVRRHFKMPRERLDIQVRNVRMDAPSIVTISRDTAERQISELLAVLPQA
jgi:hypothetical protein